MDGHQRLSPYEESTEKDIALSVLSLREVSGSSYAAIFPSISSSEITVPDKSHLRRSVSDPSPNNKLKLNDEPGVPGLVNTLPQQKVDRNPSISILSDDTGITSEDFGARRDSVQSGWSGIDDIDISNYSFMISINMINPDYTHFPDFEIHIKNGLHGWSIKKSYREIEELYNILIERDIITSDNLQLNELPTIVNTDGTRKNVDELTTHLEHYIRKVVLLSLHTPSDSTVINFLAADRFALSSFIASGNIVRHVKLIESQLAETTIKLHEVSNIVEIHKSDKIIINQRLKNLEACLTTLLDSDNNLLSKKLMDANGIEIEAPSIVAEEIVTKPEDEFWEADLKKQADIDIYRKDFWKSEEANLFNMTSKAANIDYEVSLIIKKVWPLNSHVLYRNSLNQIVLKVIKAAIGLRGFNLGLYNLKIFMPDDITHITVVNTLGEHGKIEMWCREIRDRLSALNNGHTEDVDLDMSNFQKNYSVGNIDLLRKKPNEYILAFMLDGMKYHISFDNHSELIFLPHIEELDKRIGREHLMKRSMLLIKAWWNYCSLAAKRGAPRILNDHLLSIMIASMFNNYGEKVHHPFQALCIFIFEYGSLDWSTHVFTFYGNYPIEAIDVGPDEKSAIGPRDHHVLRLEDLVEGAQWYRYATKSISLNDNDNNSVQSNNNNPNKLGSLDDNHSYNNDKSVMSSLEEESSQFMKSHMNIAHPLSNKDNIGSDLSYDIVMTIRESLRHGIKDLRLILQLPEPSQAVSTVFQEIISRFSRNSYEDSSQDTKNRCSLDVDVDCILDEISYSIMTTSGDLAERGFKVLFRELLEAPGALPVGEIGKMLQGSTGFKTLSVILKSTYGGLKKFLEGCKDTFLIGRNHPFNPHVYLKKYLTPQDNEIIVNGGVPPGYMAKFRKAKFNNKKQQQHQQRSSLSNSNLLNSNNYGSFDSHSTYSSSNSSRNHSSSNSSQMSMPYNNSINHYQKASDMNYSNQPKRRASENHRISFDIESAQRRASVPPRSKYEYHLQSNHSDVNLNRVNPVDFPSNGGMWSQDSSQMNSPSNSLESYHVNMDDIQPKKYDQRVLPPELADIDISKLF